MSSPVETSAAQARMIAARCTRALPLAEERGYRPTAIRQLKTIRDRAERLADMLESLHRDADIALYEANP